MNLAILFPGIGYTCDRPLMYYSGRLSGQLGFQVRVVPYSGFPPKIRGDRAKMLASFDIARAQAEDMLRDIRWADWEDVVFIEKSIGTIVAVDYAAAHDLKARHVLLTPLRDTFDLMPPGDMAAIAFHGTADPWADTDEITRLCDERHIPLTLTPGADHSLEVGDALRDIETLSTTLTAVKQFILRG